MTELLPGDEFHFIFIVDRSGSMGSAGRMTAAIDALSIFIRSLPTGCRFSVLSFGTRFSWLEGAPNQGSSNMLNYDEATKDWALERIAGFSADHGGTIIDRPLRDA